MGSRNLPSYPITLSPNSHHYGTPRDYTLRRDDGPAGHILKRQGLRLKPYGTGILTCFPVGTFELRRTLGPTNPRLTIIAEET
jgi:hypothetical protein